MSEIMGESARGQRKKTIGIIFGGESSEHEVSLKSAYGVIKNLDLEKFTPVTIGISLEGEWFLFHGPIEKIAEGTWCNRKDCIPVVITTEGGSGKLLTLGEKGNEFVEVDALFPVLHGKKGEDGTVQGILEMANIPVVGCKMLSAALCMDKFRAHQVVTAAGVLSPAAVLISKDENEKAMVAKAEPLGYPMFVKPLKEGSSHGITKVESKGDLPEAFRLALEYDDAITVEEGILGFEVGCSIVGNKDLFIGEVDEIQLEDGFFDFEKKYLAKISAIHVPARIPEEVKEKIRRTAVDIYRALDCRGFARVDMFLSVKGDVFFNEVNTIPGLTEISRFPNMLKAKGMTFKEMVSNVIELAFE